MFFLLLWCAALGGSFALNVAPPASRRALGWHDAGRCHVSRAWLASPWSASRALSGARRGFAISREMSVRADDGGRGDTPGEKSAIGVTEAEVEAVGEEIRAVGQDIDNAEEEIRAVKAALSGGPPYLGISDRYLLFEEKKNLQKEKEQLWKEKEQLRKKKEQLRKKKEQLRKEKERQRTAQALLFPGTQACICCLRPYLKSFFPPLLNVDTMSPNQHA